MAIKLAVLQGNDQIITDIKELSDDGKPVGYLLKNPHRIVIDQPFLVEKLDDEKSVQVTLTPWILLTTDTEIIVPGNQVVTIVEPIDSVKEMYLDKINGSESISTDE
tara:strand:+ start:74 stop:394 length:321 start_codon:yes stop_codon:yes gene_type:complete